MLAVVGVVAPGQENSLETHSFGDTLPKKSTSRASCPSKPTRLSTGVFYRSVPVDKLRKRFCMLMTASLVVIASLAAVPLDTSTMKNFGHSIKNGHLVANTEITLFEHTCIKPPCTITQMHCPTAGPNGWYDAVVTLYIDDEPR
jgi:hypothetical protein